MVPHHLPVAHARRPLMFIAVFAAIGLLAGCGTATSGDSGSTSQPPTGEATDSDSATTTATIYFVDDQGSSMISDDVPVSGADRLSGALAALATTEPPAGALAPLPVGTRVLSVTKSGTVATIDVSEEYASGYPSGGAAAEIAAVAPIVFTATQDGGVKAVRILVNGAEPMLTGSQFDWSRPFVREDFASLSETIQ